MSLTERIIWGAYVLLSLALGWLIPVAESRLLLLGLVIAAASAYVAQRASERYLATVASISNRSSRSASRGAILLALYMSTAVTMVVLAFASAGSAVSTWALSVQSLIVGVGAGLLVQLLQDVMGSQDKQCLNEQLRAGNTKLHIRFKLDASQAQR